MNDDQQPDDESVAKELLMSDEDTLAVFDGDGEDIDDPNDMNEISAKHTDQTPEAPDPDGPADPSATDGAA